MYSWDPKLYSSNSSAQKNWGFELLAKLGFKGNEKFLDVGCGDGKLSAEVAKSLPEGTVLGIDLSEEMITFARNHYSQEKFPNLSFMQANASELTFDSEFDIVFSNAALHWIKAPEAALNGFWKSLKPGGIFLAQLGGRGNAEEILKVLDYMLESEKWSSYFGDFVFPYGFYGPDEYGKWLKDAGFSIKRLELIAKDMALQEESGLFASIASTWHPYIQRVPQELKENFINELVALFVKNYPPDDKGYIHIQMKRLEIEAYREK
ncbi:class I SAM-dependent methyltransferase [Methanosarcina sp.]|uniref:class I SAM-dependent methyltransferase n=1 Tax=Methanosarcina sp. TaxID=2213 RepID=UPI0029888C74|nr:methyltransferase domain-containing protein [Methanosarcina sp.]MDW5551916.1 methyltransferase domain-containing protein [Methanosarcina sp.]MDW5554940.1 methyltransferase domain-containing protein [Methanosarcina sp.]MDW5559843.1 methyltransferase domain-containing protein [Methanosarcina sp.]